jgi:repressor LexA
MPRKSPSRAANPYAELTRRQQQIFDLIRNTLEKTGMPPTRADICLAFKFRSPTAAEDHLRALERKGVIELLPGRSRGIRVLSAGPGEGLPVIGRVAAGEPILAEQHIEDHFDMDPSFFQPRADYLLRVRGHSMRDGGILNGDLLAVHRTSEVYSGQIVVARLDNDVTVKRFRRRGNKVTLEPQNDEYEPIQLDLKEDDLVIEGRGVGVVRNKGFSAR